MGHAIEAIVGDEGLLRDVFSDLVHARVAPLPSGLGLLPLVDDLVDEIEFDPIMIGLAGGADGPHPEFRRLSPALAGYLRTLSNVEPFAYLETEYFGGVGTQAAVAWKEGRLAFGPEAGAMGPPRSAGVINRALRVLGVSRRPAGRLGFLARSLGLLPPLVDEFDAIGLGRHRSTEDWYDAAKA